MASFLSVVLVVHQTLNAESVRLLVYALALVCGSLEELFGFAASSRDGSDGGGEHGEVSRLLLLREEKEKVRERFFLAFGRFVCGNCFVVVVVVVVVLQAKEVAIEWGVRFFCLFFCVVRGAFKKASDG